MNEQIRELAEHAGVDSGQTIANIICGDDEFVAIGDEFNKLSKETRNHICRALEQNQEKFAMLIVKECVEQLEIGKRCDPYTGELFSCDRNDDIDYEIAVLKEHFGVEE